MTDSPGVSSIQPMTSGRNMTSAEEIKENLFCEKFSRLQDDSKNVDLPVTYDP